MPTSDELADALFVELPVSEWARVRYVTQTKLRTLARDAVKQALLDAANEEFADYDSHEQLFADALRARAEQIGQ